MLTDTLLDKVTTNFGNHKKTSIRNLLMIACSMLIKETVCLNKLKGVMGTFTGKTQVSPSSHYKRLIRFFDKHAFSPLWLQILGYSMLAFDEVSEYLIIDGTSWKWRGEWHHYLTIGIVIYNVCIPIFWVDLRKHGTSNFKERRSLIKKALRFYSLSGKILLGDREYIGLNWFKFLIECKLDFVIRLRYKAYKSIFDECEGFDYEKIVAKVMRSKVPHKTIKKQVQIEGQTYFFIFCKNPEPHAKEPILFLITTLDESKYKSAQRYGIRWKIEHCFKNLKSNGFDLECMNLKGDARRNLLMAIMVFAYVLSIAEGFKTYAFSRVITYADGRVEKAESLFRYGIDRLCPNAVSLHSFLLYLTKKIRIPFFRKKYGKISFV
jgi:hypothetical protein